MNLLFLCHRVPYPPNKGERIRAFHQIRWLAERHDVHVLALAENGQEATGARELGRFCSSVEVFETGRLSPRLRAGWASLTGGSLTAAYFRSPGLARRARQIALTAPPSAVVACSSSMAQYAPLLGKVPRLLDLVDVDSAKWSLYAEDARFPKSAVFGLEARRLQAYEKELVATYDRVAVTTGRELEKLGQFSPTDNAFVLRQGIDVDAFDGEGREEAPVPTLAFTGQMDYLPNVAAVTWFGHKVFPRLRRQRPTLEFHIVGRRPSPAVQALASLPGVHVTGEVPDIAPYLDRAWVFVAPLRVSLGVPTKILEAMASQVPTVATEAAVRGLVDGGIQHGRDLLVAEDETDLIESIERLLSERHLRERMGSCARRFVCRSYSWEHTAGQLEEELLAIDSGRPPLRLVEKRDAEIA